MNKQPNKESPWLNAFAGDISVFTVGAKVGSTKNVAVQVKDDNGIAAYQRVALQAYLSNNAHGDGLATAPTGGSAIGTNGILIEEIADVKFTVISNASGQFDITITDSGTPAFYLVLILPDASLLVSPIIQF